VVSRENAANERAPSGATDDTFMQRPLVDLHQWAGLRMRPKNCVGVRGWDCRAMSSARRIPEQEAQDSAARCKREREREREPHIPFNNVGAQWVVGWLVNPPSGQMKISRG